MKSLKNSLGISIIEVMVASVILMIVALGVMNLIEHQQNQFNEMKNKAFYLEVTNKVRSVGTSESALVQTLITNDTGDAIPGATVNPN